ncbi:MAG: alpha/beta fold hydrolase [Planctomycetes bacterium]|nr:alpha/beta fold hydrolase [Planctomycetota bacterium]
MKRTSWQGHWWTIMPRVLSNLPARRPPLETFSTRIAPEWGGVELHGFLARPVGARDLVIVLHGLGGEAASPYCMNALTRIFRSGLACLSVASRGADRKGEDFYHAGLSDDVHGLMGSEIIGEFERVFLLGFSVGGHIALKSVTEEGPRRPDAVAAVCPPIDLGACSRWMDEPQQSFYRRHVLRGLVCIYQEVALKGAGPSHLDEVRAVDTFRDWDRLTVVPRYGFDSVDDYYEKMSVGPRLDRLHTPALLVAAEQDPMVPAFTLRPHLERPPELLQIRWVTRGGHLGFPRDLDLGFGAQRGLVEQVLHFFRSAGR